MKQENKERKKRRLAVWKLVVMDLLLSAAAVGVFLLFYYVLPEHSSNKGEIISSIESTEQEFSLPGKSSSTDENGSTDKSGPADGNGPADKSGLADKNGSADDNGSTDENGSTDGNGVTDKNGSADENSSQAADNGKGPGRNNRPSDMGGGPGGKSPMNGGGPNMGNTGTTKIASDTSQSSVLSSEEKTTTQVKKYSGDHFQFTVNKVEMGSGKDKITYYISDIYVKSVKYLKTAFASGEYGKNLRDDAADIAKENNAVLAISGDFYGNSEKGVVIRNGVLYRSEVNDADICVLYTDGTMKTYAPDEFDKEEVIKAGAWQAWTFGPRLLDGKGNILSSFNTTAYLNGNNPRCALGYVDKGHYIFVVVDGRKEGYSRGVTLSELAWIMADAGCKTAYNLDGGKSASMVYEDEYVNQPADGGREISDIVYLGE